MRILFIDTSSADVSISIVESSKILSNIRETIPNKHSIYTVSFLDEALKKAGLTPNDIEKILVVTGPGSFTGVRIGVAIAKTFAYVKKIDITSVSSLKMLALSSEHNYCLSLIDAKHGNYYLGLYDKNNNEVIPEQFNNENYVLELINKYKPTIICNEDIVVGGINYSKQIPDILKIVSYYQKMESDNIHLVVPNYLKLPQALEERNND